MRSISLIYRVPTRARANVGHGSTGNAHRAERHMRCNGCSARGTHQAASLQHFVNKLSLLHARCTSPSEPQVIAVLDKHSFIEFFCSAKPIVASTDASPEMSRSPTNSSRKTFKLFELRLYRAKRAPLPPQGDHEREDRLIEVGEAPPKNVSLMA